MTKITIAGRAVADAEMKFTPSGAAVANFTIVENRRKFDKQRNEWVDDGASFYRCQAWRHLAESCAEHIRKGSLVIVVGELAERQWEDRDGNKRSAWEVTADEVGMALAKFPPRDGAPRQQSRPAENDPWASNTGPAPF